MAIIFIPGIKGSELVDTYPLDWPRRWSLEDMVVGDIVEDPLDFQLDEGRYDAADGHRMQAGRLIHYAYGKMVTKLRAWQTPHPLYTFSYDWRKPLELTAAALVRAMDDISGREQAAGRTPELKFVAHSMGGLLLRSALGLRNARDPFAGIGRVVFIAPPFLGSISAPQALVTGEKDGWFGSDEDYRRIARSFPPVYQMTPSWLGAAVDENGAALDLFDVTHWQANVRASNEFQPEFLLNAEAFVRGRKARYGGESAAPMLADATMQQAVDKVLVLCGTGIATEHTLPVHAHNKRNPYWFDFANAATDKLGDGRVPMRSAAVKGLTLAAFADSGAHALLCRNERVTNLTSLWLEGHKALKMTRRAPHHSVNRPGRSYFEVWNGDPANFEAHIA